MAENREKPEELAESIRRKVEERLRENGVLPREPKEPEPSDDFWNLGAPKPRVYAKPSFSVDMTEVSETPEPNAQELPKTAEAEKILPREAYPSSGGSGGSVGRSVNTVDGPRIVTGSYRRRAPSRRPLQNHAANRKEPPALTASYQPGGPLLQQIDVRTWESEMEFYGRFQADAEKSHAALPEVPYTERMEPVSFFSYLPQYSILGNRQLQYYRWVRENIRHGLYPECDLPYVQLYLFELLNLPALVPPEEGVSLLASLWRGYRERYPRLDGYLCEWLPDYCMIHGQPLPEALKPLLPSLVPKAQFKEFFLNLNPDDDGERLLLSRCLIETLSDYDYRSSRYYPEHREAYETEIPAAVSEALRQARAEGRGLFAFERVYQMTRDSYCGAIVSSAVKRRLDIRFCSYTRRADARLPLTALVKYAENKVRTLVGVKAKLGYNGLDPADGAVLDRRFEPRMPDKNRNASDRPPEDRYMPEDYLRNYEAATSGFDPAAAAEIEKHSWINTSRLTGEDYGDGTETEGSEVMEAAEASEPIDGELNGLPTAEAFVSPEEEAESEPEAPADESPAGESVSEALRAALDGTFRDYARTHGCYEGELADRINTIFLDVLGDVVLEDGGGGFALIEDYREDVEEWLSAQ